MNIWYWNIWYWSNILIKLKFLDKHVYYELAQTNLMITIIKIKYMVYISTELDKDTNNKIINMYNK